MASKRWEKQVQDMVTDGWSGDAFAVSQADTIKLLARQHTAMVRMAKRAYTYSPNFRGCMVPCEEGEWINVKDLLAALATHRKGRR